MSEEQEQDWSNEKYLRKINQLRTTNAALSHEIETLGGAVEVTIARIEHLVAFLVQEGVISEGQQVREQYDWEKGLRGQLIPLRDGLRSRLEAARARGREAQRRAQQAAKPVEGSEKPALILPPGAKK